MKITDSSAEKDFQAGRIPLMKVHHAACEPPVGKCCLTKKKEDILILLNRNLSLHRNPYFIHSAIGNAFTSS